MKISKPCHGRVTAAAKDAASGRDATMYAEAMALPLETTVEDVVKRRKAGEKLVLLDVREPPEIAIAKIEGAEWIPMRAVPSEIQKIGAMADEATVIVYCHHGMRSLDVVSFLRRNGVEECQSMAGGIDRWSVAADPAVPRY